jgi:Cytochrome domain of cellobiose dehydrogenase
VGATSDIFFQISGPSTMSWMALGQGGQMAGANIFVIYANAAGTNVTLSSRLGTGEQQPNPDTTAMVTLLDGSGIVNGMMVANVKCKRPQYHFISFLTTQRHKLPKLVWWDNGFYFQLYILDLRLQERRSHYE